MATVVITVTKSALEGTNGAQPFDFEEGTDDENVILEKDKEEQILTAVQRIFKRLSVGGVLTMTPNITV